MPTDALLADVNARLPKGYRAREFADSDREPIVAEGNAESHPMERQSAADWRFWEERNADPARRRFTIVTSEDAIAGTGSLAVGMMRRPDGSQFIFANVFSEHRNRGVGSALLTALEAEAKRRAVPRVLSGASGARPFAIGFARKRGYREIGRRIMSYRELATYDPAAWRESLDRVASAGVVLRTFTEITKGKDAAARDRFWHDLWEAEGPMWDDIPFSSPSPHWPYEKFREMVVESPRTLHDVSLVAFHGEQIVGYTVTGVSDEDGHTYMTGVARDHRGKGIAMALKVDVLARAKAAGLRAMKTVNDEPNKAMRGVNLKLGYQPVPDNVELEKVLQ